MIFIVIPVYNRWQYTQACLSSLESQSYTEHKIIVVDHGSTDGTSGKILKKFPAVILIKGDDTMWWATATNLGVQFALDQGATHILTLNNDLVVDKDYLHSILNASVVSPNSIIGSVSVDIDNNEHVAFAGIRWNRLTAKYTPSITDFTSLTDLQLKHTFVNTDLLPGRGTLFPSSVFKDIGLFDDRKFPHYMADEDLSYKARIVGYNLFVSTNAIVFSHISATGLNSLIRNSNKFSLLKDTFTSIKSPNKLSIRWNWSHNASFPIIYFFIDFGRIFFSQVTKIIKNKYL